MASPAAHGQGVTTFGIGQVLFSFIFFISGAATAHALEPATRPAKASAHAPSKKMAVKKTAPLAKPPLTKAPIVIVDPIPAAIPSPTPPPTLSIAKNAPLSAKPYWKSKPALLKRMLDERFITVSVKRESLPDGRMAFIMAGAGDVNREKEASARMAQDYPKLKEISDHFKTVSFEEKTQKLFIISEALGYEARMLLQLTPISEDWRSEVQWEVIWGSFKGMKGLIGFERLGPRSTEVSFQGRYEAKELPLPPFLMGFALEVIVQKVAEKMRTYLEAHVP